MTLGALLDLGLSQAELEADLAGLKLPHRLVVKRVQRKAIAARHLDVQVPGAAKGRKRAAQHHDHHHPHDHDHPHAHAHGHATTARSAT